MVAFPIVEVPGYREAVKKEHESRHAAFLGGNEVVCGVEVAPLNLLTVLRLETARNGFIVPCQFDNDSEAQAHAAQVLYFARPGFDPNASNGGRLALLREGFRVQRFIWRLVWKNPEPLGIAKAVKAWVHDAFMDAPKGGGGRNQVERPPFAAYPAFIVDQFGHAGIRFSYDEIVTMPLRRLWQHWRVAAKRANPKYGITNPSDELLLRYINPAK